MSKHKRIQWKRGMPKMPPNTKLVSRASRWGNPVKVSSTVSQSKAVEMFVARVDNFRHTRPDDFEEWIAPLRGYDLACACEVGTPCHADVLLELADQRSQRAQEIKR